MNPLRYLVLWVTTACNAHCAYCYRNDEPPRVMSEEIARAALDLALGSGARFHVQIAGGEPSLALDLVRQIGAWLRESGAAATIAMQTNGTLVDAEVIDACRRYAIEIGMSIDGPPKVHERLRGKASATFRGLALLAEAKIPVRVTTVLTKENTGHLSQLALTLAAFENVTGFGMDVLVNKGRALLNGSLSPDEDQVFAGTKALLETMEGIRRIRNVPLRWRELDAVREALSGAHGPRPFCHACRGESLAVHPDGTAYPCAQNVGDPAAAVGSVFSVDWNRLRGFYKNVRLRGLCGDCPLSASCPGDCPSRLRYNAGRSDKILCAIYRAIAAALMEGKVR
ncbi:MAG: radical SAM protein [Acidobacteriota bacterium]|jgi:uncharacterized protein|nr:radical SAM protein [Acidobacteriota bacterium]NLT32767.1 radical SAM protein [Acidobacteriota bacterium]